MSKPTDENRALARSIADTFGGVASVRDYFDDKRVAAVDIMTCAGAPQDGVSCHATLALSDVAIFDGDGDRLDFGVELVGACEDGAAAFVNALSTCAFHVIKDRLPVYPGAVFSGVFDLYEGLSRTMSHAFLVEPVLWGEAFSARQMETKTVAFLQVIPISDSEFAFLRENGPDALEEMFEDVQIDVFDINRPPVI